MLQNRRFSALASSSLVLELPNRGAAVRNSIVLGNSVSADRSGMAASRFLAAAATSGILLCFASQGRKSHCDSCVKVANDALAAFKKCCKIFVFPLWPRNPFLELPSRCNLWSPCA